MSAIVVMSDAELIAVHTLKRGRWGLTEDRKIGTIYIKYVQCFFWVVMGQEREEMLGNVPVKVFVLLVHPGPGLA